MSSEYNKELSEINLSKVLGNSKRTLRDISISGKTNL